MFGQWYFVSNLVTSVTVSSMFSKLHILVGLSLSGLVCMSHEYICYDT